MIALWCWEIVSFLFCVSLVDLSPVSMGDVSFACMRESWKPYSVWRWDMCKNGSRMGGDAREWVFEVLHASVEISAGFIELMWRSYFGLLLTTYVFLFVQTVEFSIQVKASSAGIFTGKTRCFRFANGWIEFDPLAIFKHRAFWAPFQRIGSVPSVRFARIVKVEAMSEATTIVTPPWFPCMIHDVAS